MSRTCTKGHRITIRPAGWDAARTETDTQSVTALASRLGLDAGYTSKVLRGRVLPSNLFVASAVAAFDGTAAFLDLFRIEAIR